MGKSSSISKTRTRSRERIPRRPKSRRHGRWVHARNPRVWPSTCYTTDFFRSALTSRWSYSMPGMAASLRPFPLAKDRDGAAFDPQSSTAFSSNSDGTLTVVHEDDPDHYRVVANIATPPRSRTVALDTKKHRVILATAEFGAAPASTADEPHPRPVMKPDSFGILIVG